MTFLYRLFILLGLPVFILLLLRIVASYGGTGDTSGMYVPGLSARHILGYTLLFLSTTIGIINLFVMIGSPPGVTGRPLVAILCLMTALFCGTTLAVALLSGVTIPDIHALGRLSLWLVGLPLVITLLFGFHIVPAGHVYKLPNGDFRTPGEWYYQLSFIMKDPLPVPTTYHFGLKQKIGDHDGAILMLSLNISCAVDPKEALDEEGVPPEKLVERVGGAVNNIVSGMFAEDSGAMSIDNLLARLSPLRKGFPLASLGKSAKGTLRNFAVDVHETA